MRVKCHLLWLFLALPWSCSRPDINWGIETFNHKESWKEAVVFDMDLPDSSAVVGIDICAQFYGDVSASELPVVLYFEAPDSTRFCDSIRLPMNVMIEKHIFSRNGKVFSVDWPYRRGIINRKPGRWRISAAPDTSRADATLFGNVRAVGLAVRPDNGK